MGLGTLRGLLKSHRRAAETAQSVKGVSHEHENLSSSLRPTFSKPNKTGTEVHTFHPTAGDGKNGSWASLASKRPCLKKQGQQERVLASKPDDQSSLSSILGTHTVGENGLQSCPLAYTRMCACVRTRAHTTYKKIK